jgi:hypothetical protein
VKYLHEYRETHLLTISTSGLTCPADFPVLLGGGCGDFGNERDVSPNVRFNGPEPGRSNKWRCVVEGKLGTVTNPTYYSIMAICGKGVATNVVPQL